MNSSKNVTREMKNNISEKVSTAVEKSREVTNTIKEKAKEAKEKVDGAIKGVKEKIPESVTSRYGSFAESTSKFTQANTSISKFVFIVVVLMLFVFFFNLGAWAIQKFMGGNQNPTLLDGMVSANKSTKISVNPNNTGSRPIYRSVNEDQGIEFTWNVWFFIDSLNINNPSYSRIFSKGSENNNLELNIPENCRDRSCKNIFNNSPGLFITQNRQNDSIFPNSIPATKLNNRVNLILLLNTFKLSQQNSEYAESITIENVPVQKWVCATIRVQQTTVDIYINGTMTQRKILNNVPRQNYYDVVVGDVNDGFNGSISSLRYFNQALGYDEIQQLYGKGPNLTALDNAGLSSNMTDYISMNWYYK
jgi:hypothetical protein